MRWLCDSRFLGIILIALGMLVYLISMGEVIALLWPYRDYPLVQFLGAFLSGGHLEELSQETGALL